MMSLPPPRRGARTGATSRLRPWSKPGARRRARSAVISVSGGCVEGAVVGEAIDVIGAGKPKMLEFGVADETAWRVGLSCGGRIKVYVEKLG
jgi:xanthine/CO dehydrogenase XdhC/CoxF family maturation factor